MMKKIVGRFFTWDGSQKEKERLYKLDRDEEIDFNTEDNFFKKRDVTEEMELQEELWEKGISEEPSYNNFFYSTEEDFVENLI